MTASALLEDESMVKLVLQEREGGETEVETPVGFVDLVTDDYVIELKHVKSWKEGTKVLLFTEYLGDRKPRIHLFGGYTKEFKSLVEAALNKLGITVTWEREPF
jgi:hypothetical protein